MSENEEIYDALIVGGGPAGASAAIHLAMKGARVAVAEAKSFPRAKLCGEFISPECLDHFARLGVMERMGQAGGVRLLETVFYSRGGRGVRVPSEWFGAGQACALGLSRALMDHALLLRAREAGAVVLESAPAAGLLTEGGRVCGARLKLNGEALELRARVTIDATGRTRFLARRAEQASEEGQGSRGTKGRRAPLVAFKAHLEGTSGGEGRCEIYFYGGGYGGLNQVEGDLSNLCFIASARDVRACASDPERVMREVVCRNERAARTLAGARVRSEWLSVALEGFGRRGPVPMEGLLAIGDAASFIDPFTGSGMLMALESGELAAEVVARWLPLCKSDGASFDLLAQEFQAKYAERFNARLRVCSLLRRAAFVPRLAEAAMLTFGASERVRRRLARSTRGASAG